MTATGILTVGADTDYGTTKYCNFSDLHGRTAYSFCQADLNAPRNQLNQYHSIIISASAEQITLPVGK